MRTESNRCSNEEKLRTIGKLISLTTNRRVTACGMVQPDSIRRSIEFGSPAEFCRHISLDSISITKHLNRARNSGPRLTHCSSKTDHAAFIRVQKKRVACSNLPRWLEVFLFAGDHSAAVPLVELDPFNRPNDGLFITLHGSEIPEPAHRICRARCARLERRTAGDGEDTLAAVVKLRCVSKLGPFSLPSPGRQMTQQKDAIARLQRAVLKKRLERWCCLCALLSLLFCLLGEKKCERDL